MVAIFVHEGIIHVRYPRAKGLYYITHINNVPSILKSGILSHERVEKENITLIL
ncbi:MAG: DUF4433 domain-containing protein [Chloroflexi bacterium]|nr:DUF4433 domain-containing protein [Chloroflexota bacterium]